MPYTIGEHVVASSSKLILLDKLLADLLPKGERVLIFSVCLLSSEFQRAFHTNFMRGISNGQGTVILAQRCYPTLILLE
jgi:hypothetical protein